MRQKSLIPTFTGYPDRKMSNKKLSEDTYRILKRLNWDYEIPLDDIYAVITGERAHAGHCDFEPLFVRMLEQLSWHELLELLGREALTEYLTSDAISQVRLASLRDKNERLRNILRGNPLSFTKWDSGYREEVRDTLFSNRWYST